jgi:hypothetical protein
MPGSPLFKLDRIFIFDPFRIMLQLACHDMHVSAWADFR